MRKKTVSFGANEEQTFETPPSPDQTVRPFLDRLTRPFMFLIGILFSDRLFIFTERSFYSQVGPFIFVVVIIISCMVGFAVRSIDFETPPSPDQTVRPFTF